MRRLLAGGVFALIVTLGGVGTAYGAPNPCTAGEPGCKTETTGPAQTKPAGASPGFNETGTETQRGNVDAKGTESTETTTSVCTGPSGKPLAPDHPQCS